MKSFLKYSNLQLKIGLILLIIIFTIGFIFPLFRGSHADEWNSYPKYLKPGIEHIFGTNALGQDIFWLLAKSIRSSLIIGLIVAFFATIIGVFLGMLAGLQGGYVDRIISLVMDTFIVVPSLPILILIASLLKGQTSVLAMAAVLILFSWSWPARQVRSMALSLRERDFIDTARFSGESKLKILIKEFLPFILSWSAANFINTILSAIRMESTLAVIGMSNNSLATLGTMIYWALQYQAMLQGKWLWIGVPVIATIVIFGALFMTLSGAQKYNATKRGQLA